MAWNQVYDPLGNWAASTLFAALPIFVLLGTLAFLRLKAHAAALLGLGSALAVSVLVFGMPADKALAVSLFGAAYGLFPIGWIILNVIFLYTLADDKGTFKVLQESLTGITRDRRLQLLLIAFSFGAFFEGAAGFGTPVAVTAAILIGLGFGPLAASGLSLIANTAPVAFGALGTPIIALSGVTGIEIQKLSAMVGRQLPFFSILVPFWLVWAFTGFRGMIEVWPALLIAGAAFAIPQFLVSNFHGPWLVDVISAASSILALILLLLVWRPRNIHGFGGLEASQDARTRHGRGRRDVIRAWTPWLILSILVFIWGIPQIKTLLDGIFILKIPVPAVDGLINRVPPVVVKPTAEAAVYAFNVLSFTGTGIFLASLISALFLGYRPREAAAAWWKTLKRVRFSLLTVAAMLALGYTTRYSGLDAAMGLTFAKTGLLYPFFGHAPRMAGCGPHRLGHLIERPLRQPSEDFGGTSRTRPGAHGLGKQQRRRHGQDDRRPKHRRSQHGHEVVWPRRQILRYVFFHSLALASLVGLLVTLQAYVFPFTKLVVK